MSYFFDLEERLRMLELEVKQQRYDFESPHDKLHKFQKQLQQLEDRLSQQEEEIDSLQQGGRKAGGMIEKFMRKGDKTLVCCRGTKKRGGQAPVRISIELACDVLLACEDMAGGNRKGTFTMEDLKESRFLKNSRGKRSEFDIALLWLKSLGMVGDVDGDSRCQILYEEVNVPQDLLHGEFERLPEYRGD